MLAALVIGLSILTSRAILLARELEDLKRAQIRQANMNMAFMVTGTVLSWPRTTMPRLSPTRMMSSPQASSARAVG